MTTTISNGTTTVTLVTLGTLDVEQDAGNLGHTIIGAAALATTLRPAGLRKGTYEAVLGQNAALAQSLQTMLTATGTFTLADTTVTALGMTFILAPGGTAHLSLDDDTRSVWSVTFDFQEIGS